MVSNSFGSESEESRLLEFPMKKKDLISLKESAHILGYQQTAPVLSLIENNFLKAYKKAGCRRKWLKKNEVLELPELITNCK